jgi:hypothetical protein
MANASFNSFLKDVAFKFCEHGEHATIAFPNVVLMSKDSVKETKATPEFRKFIESRN